MRKIPEDAVKDEVTYIFLVKDIEKGGVISAAQRKKEVTGVNNAVRKEGGQCRLYSTRGSPYDFISVIMGIGPAAAMRIVEEIEKHGTVKATLISGLEVFHTP